MEYKAFFKKASEGSLPFPYQERLATSKLLPSLLDVPTGAGKTASVILGWLWRRRFASAAIRKATPRRLVYCLPMRVLVEQTAEACRKWLDNLGLYNDRESGISVYILMGGERDNDWDLYPEQDTILIGTQDMLLSRALNRGYGASRYRWPAQFGLLHSDCLWVFDETQMFGVGLKTSAQLEAFRSVFKTTFPSYSLWMSATLNQTALMTVDAQKELPQPMPCIKLEDSDKEHPMLQKRLEAGKALSPFKIELTNDNKTTYTKQLAADVWSKHNERMGQTLVVLNTVGRAQECYGELQKLNKDNPIPILLIHSRYRPYERAALSERLKQTPPEEGRIIVATQAIEAGVDISSKTLITELAPWSSMVQRFGRCNRYGEYGNNEPAQIHWIDVESDKVAAPYEKEQLDKAREILESLTDAGLASVENKKDGLPEPVFHVIRRKDIVELFDTTPDLAGADIDISRFIRDEDNLDVQLYWRILEEKKPEVNEPEPDRNELCAVPINRFRDFFKKSAKEKAFFWIWDPFDGNWVRLEESRIRPGLTILADINAGGYDTDIGWLPKFKKPVTPVSPEETPREESNSDDPYTPIGRFITIAEHSNDVVVELETLLNALDVGDDEANALRIAARYHDWGKAHEKFQELLTYRSEEDPPVPEGGPWAKSDKMRPLKQHPRPQFRHELASALAALQIGQPDLVCYLIAAHHGKVRLSIRSMPEEEIPPEPGRRFARGIWDGETLPACDLGGKDNFQQESKLDLEAMELGRNKDGVPSWLERTLILRDAWGPFRLAYLEILLRAADRRASKKESQS